MVQEKKDDAVIQKRDSMMLTYLEAAAGPQEALPDIWLLVDSGLHQSQS